MREKLVKSLQYLIIPSKSSKRTKKKYILIEISEISYMSDFCNNVAIEKTPMIFLMHLK